MGPKDAKTGDISMRRSTALAAGALLATGVAVTGCARIEHPMADPQPSISVPAGVGDFQVAPSPSPAPTPAKAAGGLCTLLDYEAVARATGTQFEVAAASNSSGAQTCALQVLYSHYPDLVLSVADTKADSAAFMKAAPDGAESVRGLGKAAYVQVRAGGAGAGPAVQITWLGQKSQIVTIQYIFAKGTSFGTASKRVNSLISYATTLEARR
jgi:hypothetical protein